MINILPDEIINEIIKHIKINNDILNLRLINNTFHNLLKEIPVYKKNILIYKIILKNNNIKKYVSDNNQLVKEITFKPYGGTKIIDHSNYTNTYYFSTPKKRIYVRKPLLQDNRKFIGCIIS